MAMGSVQSYFHVFIVIVLGYIMVPGFLKQEIPTDSFGWWFYVLWSVFAICLGGYFAFFQEKALARNEKLFQWIYEKTGISLARLNAEAMRKPHMRPFGRALGVLFAVIGAIILLRIIGII